MTLLEIGRLGRAHGLKGEIAVTLSTNVDGRLSAGDTLDTDSGPLTITRVRPHQGKQLVTFAEVPDRTAAEALKGMVVRAEAPAADPDEGFWVHDLIGSIVREADGTERGKVTSVEANPASDLLVLDTGALVPVRFAVEVVDGVVTIDVPDGLFDL